VDERSPSLEQHLLIERFDARVRVRRDPSSGETERVVTLLADDGSAHAFGLRLCGPLSPNAPLGRERLGQLCRLLNSKLLKSREARRRALVVDAATSVRLGRGVSLVAAGSVPRLSLADALCAHRTEAGLPPHALALNHQRALSRAPAHEGAQARQARLRAALDEATEGVPEDTLSRVLHGCTPSVGSFWELQRRLTSQLGLHALLTYTLGLRTATPHNVVLRRDVGTAELVDFGPTVGMPDEAHAAENGGLGLVPFRLTRTLQHLVTPLSIDGAFAGAMCAAAECFANETKVPISLWLDALARPEEERSEASQDSAAAGLLEGVVPWVSSGEDAADRLRSLSPVAIVRAAPKAAPPATASTADVHGPVRRLVAAAISPDNLAAMPSSFQAWL
jgi:transformation/transcription domain-associated protein